MLYCNSVFLIKQIFSVEGIYDTSGLDGFEQYLWQVVKLDHDFGSTFSGVLANRQGQVRAIWASYSEQVNREEREWCAGLPVSHSCHFILDTDCDVISIFKQEANSMCSCTVVVCECAASGAHDPMASTGSIIFFSPQCLFCSFKFPNLPPANCLFLMWWDFALRLRSHVLVYAENKAHEDACVVLPLPRLGGGERKGLE